MTMRALLFLFLILISAVTFLFSPEPVDRKDYCGEYIRLTKHAGYIKNCDTREFFDPGRNLMNLFRPDCIRQSRPLYIVSGVIIGYGMKHILRISGYSVSNDSTLYAGFVLINFIVLLLGIMLYDKILRFHSVNNYLIFITSFFLICNDVTKAFMWTPHLQIFGIFTPLFTIYLMQRIVFHKNSVSLKLLLLISLGIGILCLMYGNFLLTLPCLCYAYVLNYKNNSRNNHYIVLKNITLVSFIFFLPTVLWIITVTCIAGQYYNVEIVHYRQFIWLYDKFQLGVYEFARHIKHYSINYFKTFTIDIYPFCIFSTGIIINTYVKDKKSKDTPPIIKSIFLTPEHAIFLIPTCITFFFYWALGLYADRLTFTIVPSLLCFIVIQLDRWYKLSTYCRILTALSSTVTSLVWALFHFLKYGPFS